MISIMTDMKEGREAVSTVLCIKINRMIMNLILTNEQRTPHAM